MHPEIDFKDDRREMPTIFGSSRLVITWVVGNMATIKVDPPH